MDINIQTVQNVLDTCPIGYYLNSSDINVSLDKEDKTYYNPTTNEIKISYPLIKEQLQKAEKYNLDLEKIIRSLLYHELSHAILTPVKLGECESQFVRGLINWVEDERIERILKDYYMNIDFKSNIRCALDIDNLDLSNPNIFKGESGFALCVRLGIGTPEMLEDLNEILEKYDCLIGTTDEYFQKAGQPYCNVNIYQYTRDIVNFYNKYFDTPHKTPKQIAQMLQQLQNLKNGDTPQECDMGEKQETKEEQGEPQLSIRQEETEKVKEKIRQITDKVWSRGFDGQLYQQLSAIFERTQIVEKMTSGASNGYSGVFNPRSCVRKDYKFFIHQDNKGDSKGFSKLHLNLFIDVSGSFHHNTEVTNKLLTCLTKIEKVNPNFSYDLVTINTQATLKPHNQRYVRCGGGNCLPLNLKDLYFKTYKYDAVNYNIILFDGDCMTNTSYNDVDKELKNFLALFDTKNTTIIAEEDNRRYFTKAKTAQVIYCTNYVEQLTKKVSEVLQVAFG